MTIKHVLMFVLACTLVTVVKADPLITCSGEYALCASSSTTPTGKTIIINGVEFQEGVSVCPVLTGESVADSRLTGTCAPPKGERTVWSLFSLETEYPQAPTWDVVKAVPRLFVTTEGTGGMSNQWSYPCVVRPTQINGATLADCLGPLNESPAGGGVVPVGTTVLTSAPIGAAYPVGGSIP